MMRRRPELFLGLLLGVLLYFLLGARHPDLLFGACVLLVGAAIVNGHR